MKRFALCILIVCIITGCSQKTNDIYELPKGYVGYAYVFFNVKGAPSLEQEGAYDVYPINKDGYLATSVPDMDYGTVTDKLINTIMWIKQVSGQYWMKGVQKQCVQDLQSSKRQMEA